MDPNALLAGRTRETTIARDAEGRWFHDGQALEHPNLTRAFDRWVERAEDDVSGGSELVVAHEVGFLGVGDRQRRAQILCLPVLGAEQHQVRRDAENARHVLRALHLAAHPENAVGDAREHSAVQMGTDPICLAALAVKYISPFLAG